MMKTYKLKRGSSFKIPTAVLKDVNKQPVNLTGYTVTSQVRDSKSNLVADVPLILSADGLSFSSSIVDTSNWPVQELYCDIRFEIGGQVTSSDTFAIRVEQGVTA